MSRFHHLWIVEAELEVANPDPAGDRCAERIFAALERYASEETAPYPAQVARNDDGWIEVTFPVWGPNRWTAIAAGATILAEACAHACADVGVVRMAAGESSEELQAYRERVHAMEAADGSAP